MNVVEAQNKIELARGCIVEAVRGDGRIFMEGDIEAAYHRLEEACSALELEDVQYARGAVAEALELLRSHESINIIVEDVPALADAIDHLTEIDWS